MFSSEQTRKAIETYIRFDHSAADTVRELGYPNGNATLARCVDELAPGERGKRPVANPSPRLTVSEKADTIAESVVFLYNVRR